MVLAGFVITAVQEVKEFVAKTTSELSFDVKPDRVYAQEVVLPTSTPIPTAIPTITPTPTQILQLLPRDIVKAKSDAVFGTHEWGALEELIQKESSWNHFASNPNGGACGLFQAWPCSKLPCDLSDVYCQADWGINYIAGRYGTPSKALAFWKARVPINGKDVGNWY